jgi:hypothetical protein
MLVIIIIIQIQRREDKFIMCVGDSVLEGT